jgi:hypothetical protein
MTIAQQEITDPDFQRLETLIGGEGSAVGLKHVRKF